MSVATTKPTPRLTGLDINLGKKVKIVHTYSRKQTQPSGHALTEYKSEGTSDAKTKTRLGKRKHSEKDQKKRKPGQLDGNEVSGPHTPKRAKRKMRLAMEQLVLQPFLPDNHASLEARLHATRIRDEIDENPDFIVTSDPLSPSSRVDVRLEHCRRPNTGSRKPLDIIRSHFVLPQGGQQKPADWIFFRFPPITPHRSGLQPREIGSGFEGLERQLQIQKRPTVGTRKGKRHVQNKRMAPLGFAIVKPDGSKSAEDRQQTPNSLESHSRILDGDNMEGSNDSVADIVNEGTHKQDDLALGDGYAQIERPQNPNSTWRKSNQASDSEVFGRVPTVSASLRDLGSEELPEDSDQLDSTMAMGRQDSESQHSLLPRKLDWPIVPEIPETPRGPDLEQYVNQDQGSRSPSSVLKRVPTFHVYDEDGGRKGNDEDDFAEVHSML
ncbi:MAG: hypothetical protein Q9187_006298, partial [Circinaria calcarea]